MAAAVLLLLACGEREPAPLAPAAEAGGPQVRATVVTIRTTSEPYGRSTTHAVVIGESVARSTEEGGLWRLYDFRRDRVSFIDDAERTYRTIPLASLVEERREILSADVRPEMPHATWASSGAERTIGDLTARQSVIRLGRYQRELWLATHSRIPPNLFAMMVASNRPDSAMAPLTREIDEALLAVRAFPFIDRTELPFGRDGKIVIDRVVLSVEQKEVPESLLVIPRSYEEIKAPAARPRRASSLPPRRSTPAEGSPPSATNQTTP